MNNTFPGEIEVLCYFSEHTGPALQSAGLRVVFSDDASPGIYFKVGTSPAYAGAIMEGINEGLLKYFPDFPKSASVTITEIMKNETDSSVRAFRRAGSLAIAQAFLLCNEHK